MIVKVEESKSLNLSLNHYDNGDIVAFKNILFAGGRERAESMVATGNTTSEGFEVCSEQEYLEIRGNATDWEFVYTGSK